MTLLPTTFPESMPDDQRRAIMALLAGGTASAAAHAAGVGRTTLYRWREDPQFLATWNQLRHELAASSLQALRALAPVAIETIRQLLLDRRAPAAVRLRAALEVVALVREQHIGPTTPEGAKAEQGRRVMQRALGI